MSSIEEYRRQLSEQVAAERADSNELRWNSRLESLGAEDVLGSPHGDMSDLDNLREAIIGPRSSPDSAFRSEALGQFVSKSERLAAPQLPLEILANPQETVQVRLTALRILGVLAISSPTFPEWRPVYLEALRAAIDVPDLRLPAFNALISQGDRRAQELLIEGLENPERALVNPADALNFLSEDSHADVRELARQIVDRPPDERTLEAAIRHLAGDPSSVDRLRALVSDQQQTIAARKLAVAALNALAPESLPVSDTQRSTNFGAESANVETAEDPVEEFMRILISRRRRPS